MLAAPCLLLDPMGNFLDNRTFGYKDGPDKVRKQWPA